MFFQSWMSVAQTVITGVMAYAALIVLLRVSGKRTLAKMNAFDLVVTVALGSTLSTILLSREVPLVNGVVALAVLVGLQFAVAWTSLRVRGFEDFVKSAPSLLLYRGEPRYDDMRRQRVSEEELEAAIRSAGLAGVQEVGAVVLETDGTFSVIRRDDLPAGEALTDLIPHPHRQKGDGDASRTAPPRGTTGRLRDVENGADRRARTTPRSE